jgi:hypothetical protein
MSRAYRFECDIQVLGDQAAAAENFWRRVIRACLDCPAGVLDRADTSASAHDSEAAVFHCSVHVSDVLFRYVTENNLCNGYSEEEYVRDFRKAVKKMTKDVTVKFKVILSLYYLEHAPDVFEQFDSDDLFKDD